MGSILATVDDTRWGSPVWDNPVMVNYWNPKIISATEHYPYGMLMRNSYASIEYRYGFNGKEYENEVQAAGNLLDYGNRLYDPLAGRFWSVDPLTKNYAMLSPYQFASNSPIENSDLDGLESISDTKAFQARQYEMAIKTYDAIQAANNNKSAFLRNSPNVPISPPNHFIAPPPDYTYRSADREKNELMFRNYLRNHGYNEDGSKPAAMRLMDDKTFNKFADNIALPTLEIASYVSALGEVSALLKISKPVANIAAKTRGLGNPFKNATLSQVDDAFQVHVQSGKLQLKYVNPETGAKAYQNTKSGYSYNLDPGGMYGKKLELPHIDVNYPKPKPTFLDKKKLPVSGGF